jgi:protein phosphatase
MLYLEHYGATDAGKVRKNNEDALLLGAGQDDTLFAVADGIGGFEAGEVASGIAVEALKEVEPGGSVEVAIREANRRILAASRSDEGLSGMGTTVVAVRFGGSEREPVAEVFHVGDSRAYLFRDGELSPITEDHSLVAELVRSGSLTRAQASEHPQRNLITRALGADESVEVDRTLVAVRPGDRLLLCSDGLTDMVSEPALEKIFRAAAAGGENPEKLVRSLVSAALQAGGGDNVTVVVVDVREEQEPENGSRRGDTAEMRAVPRPEAAEGTTDPLLRRERRARKEGKATPRRSGRRSKGGSEGRLEGKAGRGAKARGGRRRWGGPLGWLAGLVRVLAALAVVGLLAAPFYMWGSSRYYLGFDGGEVVVYRGLPYAPFGAELSEEFRRTGLRESEVREPYRTQVEEHSLYTREEADQVVRDLGDDLDREERPGSDGGGSGGE